MSIVCRFKNNSSARGIPRARCSFLLRSDHPSGGVRPRCHVWLKCSSSTAEYSDAKDVLGQVSCVRCREDARPDAGAALPGACCCSRDACLMVRFGASQSLSDFIVFTACLIVNHKLWQGTHRHSGRTVRAGTLFRRPKRESLWTKVSLLPLVAPRSSGPPWPSSCLRKTHPTKYLLRPYSVQNVHTKHLLLFDHNSGS